MTNTVERPRGGPGRVMFGTYRLPRDAGRLLGVAEERRLARRAARGDRRARQKLVEHNLRLVISVAMKFRDRGLPAEDLVQEGITGLLRAVDKYEPERGHKFSTYAVYWIRQSVQRALNDTGRTIRIPNHQHERRIKLVVASAELYRELSRQPAPDELAARLGWSEKRVREVLDLPADAKSLDAPLSPASTPGKQGDRDLQVSVPDPDQDSDPAARATEHALTEQMLRALDRLDLGDREILVKRYGLGGNETRTLKGLAADLGTSVASAQRAQTAAERRLAELVGL